MGGIAPSASNRPRRSLQDLPTELRLMIYEHLLQTTTTHIDSVGVGSLIAPVSHGHLRTIWSHWVNWRPCPAPDPTFPFLCSRPPFSPFHPESASCCPKFDNTKGNLLHPFETFFIASIALTCRQFYLEVKPMLRIRPTSLILESNFAGDFLFSRKKHFGSTLTHLTVMPELAFPTDQDHLHNVMDSLRHVECPNLEVFALQTRQPKYKFHSKGFNLCDPNENWRSFWFVERLATLFEGRPTAVVEFWVVAPKGELEEDKAAMMRIRGVIEPGEGKAYWTRKSTLDVFWQPIADDERDAEDWRRWWKGKDMGLIKGKRKRRRERKG